jgi:hypothetical protein
MLASRPLSHRAVLLALALLAALVLVPAGAAAQLPPANTPGHTFALAGGVSQYDVDVADSATKAHFAVRYTRWLRSAILLELGTGLTRYGVASDHGYLLIPEAQIQGVARFGRLGPYFGLGGGAVVSWVDNADTELWPTLSAAGGLRVGIIPELSAGIELRVRTLDEDFSGHTAEWTLGVAWRP